MSRSRGRFVTIAILAALLLSTTGVVVWLSRWKMEPIFSRELEAAGLPQAPPAADPIIEQDIASLPTPVKRYLRFMGIVGRPRDWSFRAGMTGRFRRSAGEAWMSMEALQYNSRLEVARLFYLRVTFFGLVPVLGRDTYLHSDGRMLIRPLDLFTLEDATGIELDTGELVTYLDDAILIAPSLVLGPETTWTGVDDDTFDVSLTDGGLTVTARVSLDGRGAPRNFSTTDRFYKDPEDPDARWVRTRWSTPVRGWQGIDGRQIFSLARAVWHLPDGDLPYAEMRPVDGTVVFNVPPSR